MIWYKYIQIYMFWSLWIKDDWKKKILISERKGTFFIGKEAFNGPSFGQLRALFMPTL